MDLAGAEGARATASIAATRSMGVALTSCTVPAAGKPTFASATTRWRWASASMASPGAAASSSQSADAIAEEMVQAILGDLGAKAGRSALLLVNGFGGTPAMELYLMYNAARAARRERGVTVARIARRQLRHLARHGRLLASRWPISTRRCSRLWDAPCTRPASAGACDARPAPELGRSVKDWETIIP